MKSKLADKELEEISHQLSRIARGRLKNPDYGAAERLLVKEFQK